MEGLQSHDDWHVGCILYRCESFRSTDKRAGSETLYLSHADYSWSRCMAFAERIRAYDPYQNKRPVFTVDILPSVTRPYHPQSGNNYQLTIRWQSIRTY